MKSHRNSLKRFIAFDGGCHVCTEAAETAINEMGGWAKPLDLNSEEARQLLQAGGRPNLWEPALIVARASGRIRISTGPAMQARVGMALGPRRALRLRHRLDEIFGSKTLAVLPLTNQNGASRRNFITGGIAGGLGVAIGLPGTANASKVSRTSSASLPTSSPALQAAITNFGPANVLSVGFYGNGWLVPFEPQNGAAVEYLLLPAAAGVPAVFFRFFVEAHRMVALAYEPTGACLGAFTTDKMFAGVLAAAASGADTSSLRSIDALNASTFRKNFTPFEAATNANFQTYLAPTGAAVCPASVDSTCVLLCVSIYVLQQAACGTACGHCSLHRDTNSCVACFQCIGAQAGLHEQLADCLKQCTDSAPPTIGPGCH